MAATAKKPRVSKSKTAKAEKPQNQHPISKLDVLGAVEKPLQDALLGVKELIDTHNHTAEQLDEQLRSDPELAKEQSPTGRTGFSLTIDFNRFALSLFRMGYTTLETVRSIKWEDLQECGLPRALSRSAANILRSQKDDDSKSLAQEVMRINVKHSPLNHLLAWYNTNQASHSPELLKRLKSFCDDHRCIVAGDDGVVLVKESMDRLELLKAGMDLPNYHLSDGKNYKVYKIGEVANKYFNENPLYPGTPLIGTVCPNTNFDWAKVAPAKKITAYLAITETNELTINSTLDARAALKHINTESVEELFPLAYQKYRDLIAKGGTPQLILSSQSSDDEPKTKQDPFHVRS